LAKPARTSQAAAKQLGGFGADHGKILILGGRGVLGGAELHHLALAMIAAAFDRISSARSEPTSTII